MPMASFGVGGEFGVGGKYDNGERFDLRLPYADQGWVDDSAASGRDWMSRLGSKKKPAAKKPSTKRADKGKRRDEPKWIESRSGWKLNPNCKRK